MTILQIIEYCIGSLLHRMRGYDAGLFYKSRAFAQYAKPTITLTSPDCGESGGKFSDEYTKFGQSKFPSLQWQPAGPEVKQWLLLTEDPDAPMRKPNVHGIYCFIPPHVISLTNEDLGLVKVVDGVNEIKAGYCVGKNRRGVVYLPPRPPLGHGAHRYVFQLVALNKPLDPSSMSKVPTKEELENAIDGKVVGWGLWEATYEQHW